jgi:hypothetical protein
MKHGKTAANKLKEKYRPVLILDAVQLITEPRCTARLTALNFLIQHRMGFQYQNFVETRFMMMDTKIATGAPWNYTRF